MDEMQLLDRPPCYIICILFNVLDLHGWFVEERVCVFGPEEIHMVEIVVRHSVTNTIEIYLNTSTAPCNKRWCTALCNEQFCLTMMCSIGIMLMVLWQCDIGDHCDDGDDDDNGDNDADRENGNETVGKMQITNLLDATRPGSWLAIASTSCFYLIFSFTFWSK